MTSPTPSALDGAGVASSWADLASAVLDDQPDGRQIAYTTAAAGLDALGVFADPFDALLAAGLGWAIEHVAVLREPLDALAGDPAQILAQAGSWYDVAGSLREAAREYRAALSSAAGSSVTGWHGPAGDGYRASVGECTRAFEEVATRAEQLARLVLGTGAAVGTVRALIRDLVAEFLSRLVTTVLVALAATPATMGGSTAAAIGAMAGEVHLLAQDIAGRLSRLIDDLSAASRTAAELVAGMRSTAAQLGNAAAATRSVATPWAEAFDALPAAQVAEAGKQFSGAEPAGPRG